MSSVGSYDTLSAEVAQLGLGLDGDGAPLDTDTGMATHEPRTPTDSPALRAARALLRQTLRVTITDGRIFLGTFAGTDKLLNILLVNTDEFVLPQPQGLDASSTATAAAQAYVNPDGRFVGLVQIPWRLVVKAEVHRPQRERGSEVGMELGGYGEVAGEGYPQDQDDMLYA